MMSRVTTLQRIYFAAVGIMAFWVGYWCYFYPELSANGIPWTVPPLCATFLGAMYLSGGTYTVLCYFSKRWGEVQLFMPTCAIWTGGLAIISLFYLDGFDYSRHQTQIWWGAYIVYPIIAAVLLRFHHTEWDMPLESDSLVPEKVKSYLRLQGSGLILLASALLFAPAFMQPLWPWKTGIMMLQMYSMPLFAYGVASWLATRVQGWAKIRNALAAIAVFTGAEFAASLYFGSLLNGPTLAVALWLGGLAFLTFGLLILLAQSLRQRGTNRKTSGLAITERQPA
jgi:hypothetical protein